MFTNYNAWAAGEPNNTDGSASCASLIDGYYWNDLSCDSHAVPVCQWTDEGPDDEDLWMFYGEDCAQYIWEDTMGGQVFINIYPYEEYMYLDKGDYTMEILMDDGTELPRYIPLQDIHFDPDSHLLEFAVYTPTGMGGGGLIESYLSFTFDPTFEWVTFGEVYYYYEDGNEGYLTLSDIGAEVYKNWDMECYYDGHWDLPIGPEFW